MCAGTGSERGITGAKGPSFGTRTTKDVLTPTEGEPKNPHEAVGVPSAVARRRIYGPWRKICEGSSYDRAEARQAGLRRAYGLNLLK